MLGRRGKLVKHVTQTRHALHRCDSRTQPLSEVDQLINWAADSAIALEYSIERPPPLPLDTSSGPFFMGKQANDKSE